jgi:hypothetical protein
MGTARCLLKPLKDLGGKRFRKAVINPAPFFSAFYQVGVLKHAHVPRNGSGGHPEYFRYLTDTKLVTGYQSHDHPKAISVGKAFYDVNGLFHMGLIIVYLAK